MGPERTNLNSLNPDSSRTEDSFERLYLYLLDATELLMEKCPERRIIDINALRALCFLVVAYRTCPLDEHRATTCLRLIGTTPAVLANAFSIFGELHQVAFPHTLVDRIALLHRLLPDVPPFPRTEPQSQHFSKI